MVGIYKVTNKINGKVYIGQSINIKARWTKHRNNPFNPESEQYNSPFYKAIRKYGLSNFTFEILEEIHKEDLDKREIYWISFYDSNNPEKGYNLTPGGRNVAAVSCVLTPIQVAEIRNLLMTSSLTEQEISEKFGVSQRTISSINLGQTWLNEDLIYPLKSYRKLDNERCPVCGGKKYYLAKMCGECTKQAQRKVERPSREELKSLIRNTSFTKIAAMYGVTDNAIRKWCDVENLPRKVSIIKTLSDEEWESI